MVSSTSTLTNCYVPLPVEPPPSFSLSSSATSSLPEPSASLSFDPSACNNNNRSSGDGTSAGRRSARSLRRLLLSTSVLTKSDGSALLELGHTKVLCSVRGPRSAAASSLAGGRAEFRAGGGLNCEVRLAPGFGLCPQTAVAAAVTSLDGRTGAGSSSTSTAATRREVELSARLYDAVAPSVRLDRIPKSVLDVYVLVLQDDGSVLPAAITAASLALADAGVELFDLVASCSVAAVASAKRDEKDDEGEGGGRPTRSSARPSPSVLLADPTEAELLRSEGSVTLAVLPSWREVTYWDQTGRMSATTSSEAVELCRDGCATMHRFMRECLVKDGSSGGGGGSSSSSAAS